ncbi:polysaccharide pyruvyl transferase family protein [Clostridium celatum]|uniref:polysaccharide pyruvyl transferase family protein n=1 Tax=Clostridium celatum TaxID=36834 RepID=UPI001898A569|nr:polysaccharide pyruvyl transferase family protein [Clostridium celatum]
MKKKKILLEVYLAKNLGDDLFIDIICNKFPEVEFVLNIVNNEHDNFINKYNNLKRRRYDLIHKFFRKLKVKNVLDNNQIAKEYDAFIILGGSMFIEKEQYRKLHLDRINLGNKFIENKKPVYILGSNFGPYYSEEFFNMYRTFFEKCTDISFRENYSFNLFKDLNNIRVNPDIVFGLEKNNIEKEKRVGFSIINLEKREELRSYEETYIKNIIKLIKKAYSEKYFIELFSFCEYEGDLKMINKIKDRLPIDIREALSVHSYVDDLKNTLNQISKMDIFVASRFHAVILSQVFNQGVIPFIYSDKTLNVLKDIKLDKIAININNFEEIDVEKIWEECRGNKINLDKIKVETENHFVKLKDFLLS